MGIAINEGSGVGGASAEKVPIRGRYAKTTHLASLPPPAAFIRNATYAIEACQHFCHARTQLSCNWLLSQCL